MSFHTHKESAVPFLSSGFFHPFRATELSSTPRESITRANGPGGSETAGGGCTTKTGPSTKASGPKTSPAVKGCFAVVSVQLSCTDGRMAWCVRLTLGEGAKKGLNMVSHLNNADGDFN